MSTDYNCVTLAMNFTYTCSNVPSPQYRPEDFGLLHCPCECETDCRPPQCQCQSVTPNYDPDGRLFLSDADNKPPIFECHSQCKCDPVLCGNRLVQRGISVPLDVYDAGAKGFALKTLIDIPSGSFICEYVGELLDESEAISRIEAKIQRNRLRSTSEPNYLIAVNERFSHDNLLVKTFIDAEFRGNLGRFANHSCQPNSAMIPVRIGSGDPHLALFAVKNISAGEEITYDYGNAAGGGHIEFELYKNSDDRRTSSQAKCLCQSAKCHGQLPFE